MKFIKAQGPGEIGLSPSGRGTPVNFSTPSTKEATATKLLNIKIKIMNHHFHFTGSGINNESLRLIPSEAISRAPKAIKPLSASKSNQDNASQSPPLTFKRWSGKGYAVFNTLRREVRIGFLATIYFCCLAAHLNFANASNDTIKTEVKLDEVEVSARRGPALFSEVGRVITVITRDEIEALPVQSVPDLLRYAMSVDIRERGPLGIQADVSMRGGTFDQVMILLNGVNITDPQTGHFSLTLPVDLQSIERVEILRGSASRIYGPNAFNGAINFITGTAPRDQVSVSGLGGDHGLYSIGTSLTYSTGDLKNYISARKSSSDGYIPNTDFEVINVFYHGSLNLDNDRLNLQAGYTDKEFGAYSFYTARFPDQFEHTRTLFSALSFETGGLIRVRPNVYFRRNHDRFELFRGGINAPAWYRGHNYHMTDVVGANINASIPWSAGVTSVGAETRGESVWSNVLGHLMSDTIPAPGEEAGFFNRQFHRNNASLFLEHTYTSEGLSISAGVLANRNSQIGHGIQWFPGIDVSYWISPNFKWLAAWNKSLRLPTFTDLFYFDPAHRGNAYLKPEEATTVETGLVWRSEWFNTNLSTFYRLGQNLIDWGRQPGETIYTSSNIFKVEATGIEFAKNVELQELFSGQAILGNLSINYTWVDQTYEAEEGYESVYVLDHLEHKINLGLDHGIGLRNFSMKWNLQYQDRAGGFTRSATGEQVEYQPFWKTDTRLTWQRENMRVFAEARNLFDVRYADLGELIQPGRWVKLGFTIDLGL